MPLRYDPALIAASLVILDLAGTFVFALSGAMTGVRHRLDLFGVLVLSTTPFIRSIGLTMAIGILAASVLVIGLRPAATARETV